MLRGHAVASLLRVHLLDQVILVIPNRACGLLAAALLRPQVELLADSAGLPWPEPVRRLFQHPVVCGRVQQIKR